MEELLPQIMCLVDLAVMQGHFKALHDEGGQDIFSGLNPLESLGEWVAVFFRTKIILLDLFRKLLPGDVNMAYKVTDNFFQITIRSANKE